MQLAQRLRANFLIRYDDVIHGFGFLGVRYAPACPSV